MLLFIRANKQTSKKQAIWVCLNIRNTSQKAGFPAAFAFYARPRSSPAFPSPACAGCPAPRCPRPKASGFPRRGAEGAEASRSEKTPENDWVFHHHPPPPPHHHHPPLYHHHHHHHHPHHHHPPHPPPYYYHHHHFGVISRCNAKV